MSRIIPALAFASGWCGIAYELLYARLLTTYLGDMFHVAAAILTAFMLGIAAGARIAHRYPGWLWAIEGAIGAYALAMAGLFCFGAEAVQETALPLVSRHPSALVGLVFALLSVPALLIGTSVPLFTLYVRHHAAAGQGGAFGAVYGAYNLGAALCVLLTEFTLLRWLGIAGSLVASALVNGAIALLLLRVQAPPARARVASPEPRPGESRPLALLFAVSVASGVFQLFFLKLAETVFGPFHENFALVLALALLGIAVATALQNRWPVGFAVWLQRGSGAAALALLAVGPAIWVWAAGHGAVGGLGWLSTALKIAVLALVGGIPFAFFGGTVPALLREAPESRAAAGRALAVSSLGNCCGYLAMVFWIFAAVPDRFLAVALVATGWAAGALLLRGRPSWGFSAASLAAIAALGLAWPAELLHYAHLDYASLAALRSARQEVAEVAIHRRFDSHISLHRGRDGSETLNINGYRSLSAAAGGRTNPRELVFGVMPALYSARRERALVLGVGTGITAGATSRVYDELVAVEVNPSILELLPHFAQHNLGLHEAPNAELVLDDGLAALVRAERPFDAVINTVTSPLYFSSSKLYTSDFFRLVRRKLAPGGVYAMWFDHRVSADGARIIFRSVREVFEECAVTYLNVMYLQLVCGEKPLRLRPADEIDWDPGLRERLAAYPLGLPLERILPALALDGRGIHRRDWDAPANTFDRPALEFLMASRSWMQAPAWSPYALLDSRVEFVPGSEVPLAGGDLADRCFVLGWLADMHPVGICERLLGDPEAVDALVAYVDLVTALERAAGHALQAAGRLRLVELLLAQGDVERAARLVEGVEAVPAEQHPLQIARARVALARGESLDRDQLARLHGSGPMDATVRELLARAIVAGGDPAAGLRHLAYLPHIGVPSPEALELERALRARRRAGAGIP